MSWLFSRVERPSDLLHVLKDGGVDHGIQTISDLRFNPNSEGTDGTPEELSFVSLGGL